MIADYILKKLHELYYYNSPDFIWEITYPKILRALMRRRASAFDREFEEYKIIRLFGISNAHKGELTVSIIGSELEAAYYSMLLFEQKPKVTSEDTAIKFEEIISAAQKEQKHSQLCIARVSQNHEQLFWEKGAVIIPDQVNQEIEIKKGFGEVEENFKEIFKTFKQDYFGLSVEIAKDKNSFENFYQHMYLPTLQKRFMDAGFAYPKEELYLHFRHGGVLFIKENGERVAGVLISKAHKKLYAIVLGAIEGNEKYVRTGYLPYLYYETIKYAREKNCERIDLGNSRPFPLDGVFRFKKKMGATVSMNTATPVIHAIFLSQPQEAVKALEGLTSIGLFEDKLFALTMFEKTTLSSKEVAHARKKSQAGGVNKAVIIGKEFDKETKNLMSESPWVILIEEKQPENYSYRLVEALRKGNEKSK